MKNGKENGRSELFFIPPPSPLPEAGAFGMPLLAAPAECVGDSGTREESRRTGIVVAVQSRTNTTPERCSTVMGPGTLSAADLAVVP